MSGLVKSERNDLIGLLHGKGGGLLVPQPFERDIFLFDTHVAGTSFIKGIEELAGHLDVDDELDFFREPDNPHDERAIVVRTRSGAKIGYIPRDDNVIFSRLMDAGKLLFGRVSAREMRGAWLKLSIKVYLRE